VLGLLGEEEGLAAQVLTAFSVTLELAARRLISASARAKASRSA
jgi:hypothetical protein